MAMSRSFGALSLTTWPSMISLPAVMSSRPATMFSVVDFPQPDGPTRMMNSPSAISRLTSDTASAPSGYFLLTLSSTISAMAPQPFTAPEVSPATMRRWKNNTNRMIGIVITTAAAEIVPVGDSKYEAPVKNWSAAGTVLDAFVDVSEIANRKSFQQKMNTRMAVVNTPGAASGAITLRNAWPGVAPSIFAAFSSSHGISRKNAERV